MANKIMKATYQGSLEINGIKISCAVLNDGTRVISERSLANAFGIRGGGAYWEKKKKQGNNILPEYIAVNNIEPFISEALKEKISESISYTPITGAIKGKNANGFRAEILPEICDAWIKANEAKVLTKSQELVAKNAYTILKGFATVGIIALVDEATGYQYEREAHELQKILSAYISTELLAWQQRFPHEFYKEIFRLRGWDYTPANIKTKPSVVGHWTNQLVYEQLPKGVLRELKKQTPKDNLGRRKHHYHRLLTEDIGHSHLEKQLVSIITLMNVSNTWDDFIKLFNKKFGQQILEFDEENTKPIEQPPISSFNKSLKTALDYDPKDK